MSRPTWINIYLTLKSTPNCLLLTARGAFVVYFLSLTGRVCFLEDALRLAAFGATISPLGII